MSPSPPSQTARLAWLLDRLLPLCGGSPSSVWFVIKTLQHFLRTLLFLQKTRLSGFRTGGSGRLLPLAVRWIPVPPCSYSVRAFEQFGEFPVVFVLVTGRGRCFLILCKKGLLRDYLFLSKVPPLLPFIRGSLLPDERFQPGGYVFSVHTLLELGCDFFLLPFRFFFLSLTLQSRVKPAGPGRSLAVHALLSQFDFHPRIHAGLCLL